MNYEHLLIGIFIAFVFKYLFKRVYDIIPLSNKIKMILLFYIAAKVAQNVGDDA